MEEYIIILDIIKQVIKGLNLSETFNLAIQNSNNSINISKIKDITYGICRYYYRLNAIINQLVKNNNYDDSDDNNNDTDYDRLLSQPSPS